MKYTSIDIETTGLDYNKCQIIEFAAVVDDLKNQIPIEELPKFQIYIKQKFYTGEPYALAMHKEIFKKISRDEWSCPPEDLFGEFFDFLVTKGGYNMPLEITVAGKNFASFDKRFLEILPNNNLVRFKHRVIDPSILYFDVKTDLELPSMSVCLERAGLSSEVKHTALEDSLAVVQLMRHKFNCF